LKPSRATIPYAVPRVKLISSVTGKELGRGEINAQYWRRQVREPVRFHNAMQTLEQSGQRVFLEVGPGSILVGLGRQCLEAQEESGKPERLWAVSARKSRGEWEQILESLGRLYERGAEVDWEGFDQGYGRRRVALPTYPFQRQRYWIENAGRRPARYTAQTGAQDDLANALESGRVPDDWFYELVWEPKPQQPTPQLSGDPRNEAQLPVVFHGRTPAVSTRPARWLIASDSKSVAAKLAERLAETGRTADIANSPQDTIHQLKKNSYECVLHISTLESSESEILDPERAAGQTSLVSSVLATIQVMISEQSKAKLWLVTSGAQPVLVGQAVLNLTQAQVWGLGRTFALEHPGSWGGLIDLDPGAGRAESVSDLVSTILRGDAEDQSAFRNGKRYVARLSRRAPLPAAETLHFLPQKNYVITGGLGGLGLRVAGWMVEHGARQLVLLGRRAPLAEAQKAIDDLTSRGARVEVRSVDVASKASIRSTFQEIIAAMGSIDGIMHAAGFIDDGLLEHQTWERMRKVLAPKVVGAWNLHEATAGMKLDFFILFSSISALTGKAGTSAYAAANAFLDALAHYRKSLGLPALSIDWGAWEGEGMGKKIGGGTGRRAGITMMPSRLALAALGSALSIQDPQIAIGALDWRALKPTFEGAAKRPLLEHLVTESTDSDFSRPAGPVAAGRKPLAELTSASPEGRKTELVKYLVSAVAPILAIEAAGIDPSRPLTDFGVDSLMALEFKNRLNTDLGVSIPTVRFLEGISLQETAVQILADRSFLSIPKTAQEQLTSSSKAVPSATGVPLGDVFRIAPAQRQAWLAKHLVAALAPILGVEPTSIDASRSLSDFGLDSLMALEFKNCIASEVGVTIPTVRFLEGPNLQEVALQIAAELPASSLAESGLSTPVTMLEFPLSCAQQQAYFGHKLTPDSAAFNLGFTAKASPHLDWPAFERSVAKLLKRHPAMRAVIVETDDGPMQRILPADTPLAHLIDATAMDENEVKELVIRDFRQNFELDQPLFRANVFRLAGCDVIYFKVDHIIFDHWSVQLCVEDLKKLYTAERNGIEADLQPIKAEYQDYVEWEAAISRNNDLWRYWQEQLDGELPVLRIPCPRQRPAALLARGEAIPLSIPPSLSARMKEVARPLKATSYTFMLAAFQVLLYRFSKQSDIVVGTSVTGREDARWTNTIGFFINVLPLRARLSGSPTFAEHLLHTRDTVLGALKHQEFPFSEMIKRLRLLPNLERVPVFQAFFNFVTNQAGDFGRVFMGAPGGAVQLGSSTLVPWLKLPVKEGRIEVGLQLGEANGEVGGYLNYNSDVLDRSTAEAMAAAYCEILEAVVHDPHISIEDLAREAEEVGAEREEIAL
jgi:acyl carrier protein